MKKFWATFLMVVAVLTVHAQKCDNTFKGSIVDYHSGEPLFSATISVIDTDIKVYSDFDGNFSIPNLCDGEIELLITHPNCQDLIYPVYIDGDTSDKIKLEHHLEELGEVLLKGREYLQKTNTGQEQLLESSQLEKYSSSSLGAALKEVSGVSSLNTGNSIAKPVIQGLHSSRVLIMNNGVRMEDQEWGAEHAPNIDINSAGHIAVIKGASALQYGGDAIGGVVIIEPENIPAKDSLYGKTILSGSSNGRGGSISTSLTKSYASHWFAKVQGTLKRFGDFEAPDYILSNTGNEEKDFSINFGLHKFTSGFDVFYSYYNSEIGILRSSHIGNVADLVRSINNKKPFVINDFSYDINHPKQHVEHQLAKLKYYKRFENLGKWNIQYDYQVNNRLEYDIRTGDDKYKPSVDLKLQTHTLNTNFKFDRWDNYKLNVGLTGSYQNNFPDPETEVRRLIPDYDQYKLGAFALGQYQINSKWLAEAGFRYDYTHLDAKKFYLKTRWENQNYNEKYSNLIIGDHDTQYLTNPVFKFNNFSTSGGLNYSFDNYQLSLNYALSNRAPNPSELFSDGLHHSAAVIELGDLSFESETSNKIGFSFSKKSEKLSFTIAPFYNYINHFINMAPNGLETTIRGSFPVWEYQQIDARMYGVDVDLNYQISNHFSYLGKFAYVNGENAATGKALINMPPANISNSLYFKYHQWHKLEVGVNGNFVFKQTQYPDNNFYTEILENGEYTRTLVDISTPPDGYFLLGLDAKTTFHPFQKGSLEVGLQVNNLLNTSYRDYLNRLRYYGDNLGRNFTLQLKINY
ncbi:TonB-dependent receptor [Zunongwangia sp.]|uniref:TonB-dependent receptor n=1 Tax=Zunongwangia sp. TaxID=1965325 RepID=UPI003AA90B45